jgi:hypothetical protein
MESTPIYENNDKFRAFPGADAVFASDVEKELLLPLALYQLSEDGGHEVLLAVPIGDEQGMIGKKNLGEHCGETWLTYSRKNGKWALDCDPKDLLPFEPVADEVKSSFQARKAQFLEKSFLPWWKSNGDNKCELFQVGGIVTSYYNWYVDLRKHVQHRLEDIPGEEHKEEKVVTLIGNEGHDYLYLGLLNVGAYSGPLLADAHFFYNTFSEKVLVIYDYT